MAEGKWHGQATEVIPAPLNKVWPILTDFGGLHTLFPKMFEACETVEGERNKVGSVRALVVPLSDGSKIEARERLLSVDDVNHTTTYKLEKSTFGWTGYVACIAAKSAENGQTHVDWTFELDPISGQTEEEFRLFSQVLMQQMLTLTKGLVAQ